MGGILYTSHAFLPVSSEPPPLPPPLLLLLALTPSRRLLPRKTATASPRQSSGDGMMEAGVRQRLGKHHHLARYRVLASHDVKWRDNAC